MNCDRNADLPGYLAQEGGQAVCIPFMPKAQLAPPGLSGDYYVQEFTAPLAP